MRRLIIILVAVGLCFAGADILKEAHPFDLDYIPTSEASIQRAPEPLPGRGIIAEVGDSRSMLGPQGKSIAVSSDGMTIAVLYGPPHVPADPEPFSGVWVAYSTDMGATWDLYGPQSVASPLRRIYPGLDGGENFHQDPGTIYFGWQEGQSGYDPTLNYTMIEENIPSSPSFSSPFLMAPDGHDIDGWWMCPAVNPDDNYNVLATTWSYFENGNSANYCWISDDGGYMWTDTIRITPVINPLCYAGTGHVRWGTGDYVFFTYHDTYGGANQYPHYVESTDGGYTWSPPDQLPVLTHVQHWWHEMDCEVINDMPFAVHNDIGTGGIFQVFYPDPDDPGSPGTWNWAALNLDGIFTGTHAYQGTTYTCQIMQYPSISYGRVATVADDIEVILICSKANYEIVPPPAGWTDGDYLGGILSIDGGRTWYPTRPLSGSLPAVVGVETAHDLITLYYEGSDTTYCYTTWNDADDFVPGNQYFELGVVWTINDTIFGPRDHGIEEYNSDVVMGTGLEALPTVVNKTCRISFNIVNSGKACLRLFDITGRFVSTVYNGHLDTGKHTFDLNTLQLANGVYIVSLESPSGTDVEKIIINR